jgi:hypothetical protein
VRRWSVGDPWDEVEVRRVMMDRVVRATHEAIGDRYVVGPEAVEGHLSSAFGGEWDAVYARDLGVTRE